MKPYTSARHPRWLPEVYDAMPGYGSGYYADTERHLICVPISRPRLLRMADELGIGRHWYHPGVRMHIDIPERDVQRVLADPRVTVIPSRHLLALIYLRFD